MSSKLLAVLCLALSVSLMAQNPAQTKRNQAMKSIAIDITHIPFSRYGAYVSITRNAGKNGEKDAKELVIHSARRRFEEGPVFALTFGDAEDFDCNAVPEAITIKNEHGNARLYIRDDDTIVIESKGLDLNLRQLHFGYGIETGERTFHTISGVLSLHTTFAVPRGLATLDGPFRNSPAGTKRNAKTNLSIRCENGSILMAMAIRSVEPKAIALPILPEKDIPAIHAEWESFLTQLPMDKQETDAETQNFIGVTWYNLWSCFVRAEGNYKHDTMLMSKKFMSSTWSWDHCFNALAMADLNDKALAKKIAMAQFNAPFVLQSAQGVLPDMWNPDLETRWGTTKPPIHGWCFARLMDRFEFSNDELQNVYVKLEKWTNWWMTCSDSDHDGIPDYPQGCDSGWDNSTLFDIGYFLESPDLPAFLILQMHTLARIAAKLNSKEKEKYWLDEADALMKRFIAHSWNGERFVAKLSHSHTCDDHPTSLLSMMPIVLGDFLPKEIRDKIASALERDFLTENGLATEMPTSSHYHPDGYWRGPIWAPSTYLMVDGLRRGGYEQLAQTIAERYCNMSAKKAKGNYENFDALTGLGRRAPGYTWSASVYMLLHWEYGY
jgi:hypothetical protein